jgi:hypothetical protein
MPGSRRSGTSATTGEAKSPALAARSAHGRAVRPAPDALPGGPLWLHRPFFEGAQNAPQGAVAQNTDPFVFGERFLYTFCRQPRNRRLRRLARGSVILVGSRKENRFVLDTVFVVADSVDHTRENYAEVAAPRVGPVFRATTLDPMYGWPQTTGGRLYLAANAEQPVDGMFSFVPCLAAGSGRPFPRPPIELPGLLKPKLAMQARTTPFADLGELAAAWQSVADQVLHRGIALGVRVDLPGGRQPAQP